MSIDRIGNVTNMTFATDVQAVKRQESPKKEMRLSDVVSIGKSETMSVLQIEWPPLFPIGHTQAIYEIDE